MQLEPIKSKQRKIFEKLKYFPEFYLAGGTALALQISHRISMDFDLFSPREIPAGLSDKVKRVFKEFKIEIILDHSEQLSIKAGETKIDFVKYNFPVILKLTEFRGVKMLLVPEIATMKALAIGYRGTLKDYIDLYFILKERYTTLKEIKRIAEEKYKNEFNFRLFLEQLIYLEDVKKERIHFLKKKVGRPEIIKFFEKEITKIKI